MRSHNLVNNPELNNLPPIKLIPLNAETASLSGRTASTRPPTDIRWVKVLEFLRSNNLAPNSRDAVWHCLDTELHDLPIETQLSTAALAFSQIADILKSRAEVLLQDTRDGLRPAVGDRNRGHRAKTGKL